MLGQKGVLHIVVLHEAIQRELGCSLLRLSDYDLALSSKIRIKQKMGTFV
jgi:hypothetical protein